MLRVDSGIEKDIFVFMEKVCGTLFFSFVFLEALLHCLFPGLVAMQMKQNSYRISGERCHYQKKKLTFTKPFDTSTMLLRCLWYSI